MEFASRGTTRACQRHWHPNADPASLPVFKTPKGRPPLTAGSRRTSSMQDLEQRTMDTAIHTHPSNAAQAKAVTAPGSLSFPGASGDLTPPSSVHEGAGSRTGQHAPPTLGKPLHRLQPLFSSPSCTHRAPRCRPGSREGRGPCGRSGRPPPWRDDGRRPRNQVDGWERPLGRDPNQVSARKTTLGPTARSSLGGARSSLGGAWWWDEQQETTPPNSQIVVAAAQLRAAPGDIPEDSDVVELDTTVSRSESVESAIAYDYSAWDTWTPGITSSATTSVNAISGSSDVSAPR
ncbi:hypothetical protein V8F06_002849 [Rhypophila decipiens]